jgi:hypothetical protein
MSSLKSVRFAREQEVRDPGGWIDDVTTLTAEPFDALVG